MANPTHSRLLSKTNHTIALAAFCFTILICGGCERDLFIPVEKNTANEWDCYDIDFESLSNNNVRQKQLLPAFRYPTVNPAKSEEIAVFRQRSDGQPLADIAIINTRTGVSTTVVEDVAAVGLDWSSKGWLAFSSGQMIYKVKANGDSLTQLTFDGENYHPKWSPNGEDLAFVRVLESPLRQLTILSNNCTEMVSYQEPGHCTSVSWSTDAKQIAATTLRNERTILITFNLQTNQATDVFVGGVNSISGTTWSPDSRFLYFVYDDFLKLELETRTTTVLKASCDSKGYSWPIINRVTKQLIAVRSNKTYVESENTIETTLSIVQMETDGNEETVIAP